MLYCQGSDFSTILFHHLTWLNQTLNSSIADQKNGLQNYADSQSMERKYECFLLGKISLLTYDAILECSQPYSAVQFLLIGSLNMLDNFNVVYSITKTLSKVAFMQATSTAFSIIFCPKCTEHRLLLTGINAVLISVDVLCIKGLYFTFLRQ